VGVSLEAHPQKDYKMALTKEQMIGVKFMVSPRGRFIITKALATAIKKLNEDTYPAVSDINDMEYILEVVYKPDVEVIRMLESCDE
tara:strand:- start:332 stop:589 length:258 start_codon:yes stop_codon:yes gene_type:complete